MNWDKYTGLKTETIVRRSAEEIVREKERAHLAQMIGVANHLKDKLHGAQSAALADASVWPEWAGMQAAMEEAESDAKLRKRCQDAQFRRTIDQFERDGGYVLPDGATFQSFRAGATFQSFRGCIAGAEASMQAALAGQRIDFNRMVELALGVPDSSSFGSLAFGDRDYAVPRPAVGMRVRLFGGFWFSDHAQWVGDAMIMKQHCGTAGLADSFDAKIIGGRDDGGIVRCVEDGGWFKSVFPMDAQHLDAAGLKRPRVGMFVTAVMANLRFIAGRVYQDSLSDWRIDDGSRYPAFFSESSWLQTVWPTKLWEEHRA